MSSHILSFKCATKTLTLNINNSNYFNIKINLLFFKRRASEVLLVLRRILIFKNFHLPITYIKHEEQ